MNSPTRRYAWAVVSSSALCSIWISGSPRRIAVDPASASRAIDAPSTRSSVSVASSPTAAFIATQDARPSTSTWLNTG